MGLISDSFLWTIRLLLAGSVVWIVLRWPRAAGPGFFAICRRIAALATVGVLAVINVVSPINAQYGWYTSWSDLWTSLTQAQQLLAAGAPHGDSASRAVNLPAGRSPLSGLSTTARVGESLQLTPTDSGGYQVFTVAGPVSGYTGQVTVWFPPSYLSPAGRQRTYPVLEAFHGYLPSPLGFFSVHRLDSVIADKVAAGRLREPVVVIPWWAPGKLDTECVNGGPGRIPMETWLTEDVPRWVYQHLRVAGDRRSWGTIGASAGGWCALMATMLHPQTYATAISLGGYTAADFDPGYIPFSPHSAAGQRYDVLRLARQHPPPVALWTLTSTPDHLSFPGTSKLTQLARAPLSVTPTVLSQGSHRSAVWEPYFGPAMEWLGSVSAGFVPQR